MSKINTLQVQDFIKKLSTPYSGWPAYKFGIIDKNGNVLKNRESLKKPEEQNSFGIDDLMALKIKKLVEKLPEGKTKLASYMAALHLIKEWNMFTDSETFLDESVTDSDITESLDSFSNMYIYYNNILEDVNYKMNEDGGAAGAGGGMTAGSGAIAGLGVNPSGPQKGISPQGEPGVRRKQQLKYTADNKIRKNPRPFRDILANVLSKDN